MKTEQDASKQVSERDYSPDAPLAAGSGGEADGASAPTDRDAKVNNAQTPPAGDIDPESTASSDATGQAGVNDRPGKDQAHPWNG